MSAPASCFDLCLRTVGSLGKTWKARFDRCVSDSLRTRSSKTSPTPSRSRLTALGLLTLSAAFLLGSTSVTTTESRDRKVVRRWTIEGQPRGVAIGANGTIYVGLADKQSVLAIDSRS